MLDKLCSHVTHNSIPFLRCRPRSWKLISFVLRNTSRPCFDPFSLSLSLEEEEEEEESCLEQLTQFDHFLLRFSPRIFLELNCLNERGDRIGQLLDFQKHSFDFQRCCFHWGRMKICILFVWIYSLESSGAGFEARFDRVKGKLSLFLPFQSAFN